MTVISLMAAALAQELQDREIVSLGSSLCEEIMAAVMTRTGEHAMARLMKETTLAAPPSQRTPLAECRHGVSEDCPVCMQETIDALVKALTESERFMAYFAGETGNAFTGAGTPKTCLAQIRAALATARGKPA